MLTVELTVADLRDDAYNHHDVSVVPTEVWAGEVHGEGQPGVVEGELGLQRDLVLLVRGVLHPDIRRREGDDLTGGCHTGVQRAGGPTPVPTTGGNHQVVLTASLPALKVTVGSTGVGHLRKYLIKYLFQFRKYFR